MKSYFQIGKECAESGLYGNGIGGRLRAFEKEFGKEDLHNEKGEGSAQWWEFYMGWESVIKID